MAVALPDLNGEVLSFAADWSTRLAEVYDVKRDFEPEESAVASWISGRVIPRLAQGGLGLHLEDEQRRRCMRLGDMYHSTPDKQS